MKECFVYPQYNQRNRTSIMLRFYENVLFEKNNICKFRGLIIPTQLEKVKNELLMIVEKQGGKISGEVISVTHGTEGNRMDMEILIPCNKEIKLEPPFSFEKKRRMEKCLLIRYEGYINYIQNEIEEINQYFADASLKAISKAHYVAKETNNIIDSKAEIDIYIEVD